MVWHDDVGSFPRHVELTEYPVVEQDIEVSISAIAVHHKLVQVELTQIRLHVTETHFLDGRSLVVDLDLQLLAPEAVESVRLFVLELDGEQLFDATLAVDAGFEPELDLYVLLGLIELTAEPMQLVKSLVRRHLWSLKDGYQTFGQ